MCPILNINIGPHTMCIRSDQTDGGGGGGFCVLRQKTRTIVIKNLLHQRNIMIFLLNIMIIRYHHTNVLLSYHVVSDVIR